MDQKTIGIIIMCIFILFFFFTLEDNILDIYHKQKVFRCTFLNKLEKKILFLVFDKIVKILGKYEIDPHLMKFFSFQ